jgi:hypothetical protein
MKHKTYLVSLIVMIIPLMGCLKVEKKAEQPATAAPEKKKAVVKQPINRELRLDDIFIEYVGLDQPNIYNVVFSWPETRDRVRVSTNGQVWFLTNTAETDRYVMNNLQGGKSYSILVEILDEKNHVITSEQRTVEVPRDYVFPRNFMLTGNMEIKNDRVFMKGSVITTENFHLTIETKNLIVLEKSVIQSFPFSHKAGPGRIGRNSGTIRISAELAKGELDLIMNSEGGGDGKQGFAGNNLITTRPGECGYAAGRNPEVYIEILDIKDFRFYHEEVFAEGGAIGPDGAAQAPPNYPRAEFYNANCNGTPVRGASAQPGKICINLSGMVSGDCN